MNVKSTYCPGCSVRVSETEDSVVVNGERYHGQRCVRKHSEAQERRVRLDMASRELRHPYTPLTYVASTAEHPGSAFDV
jgi:hypothetical protein